MIIDLFHNKIVKETMTDAFRDSVDDVLVPLLVGKYGDILERITMYEDYIADDFLFEGEWYYPLTVKLQDSEAFTSWIKWPITKKTFSNSVPYAFVGEGRLAFDFAGFVPGGFADKLQGRRIDYDQSAIDLKVEALAADPLLLVGKYSQTFIDELASQITDVLSRALGVSGIAESTMELQLVFAPNTYLEHTSENVTYRRLLLVDKGCQARDFWIKWTRLDGAVGYKVSDHVAAKAIKFELGEDVAQKIREKEYRFLAGANPDKYQSAMGKRTVTEWREITKRAIKRGDLVKVVSEAELAQHASDISDKLRAILGQAVPETPAPVEKAEDESFDLVAALAKSVLEKEEVIVTETLTPPEEEYVELESELPEIEIEEYVEETEEPAEEIAEEVAEESAEEPAEETSEESVEEVAEEIAEEPVEEIAEELVEEIIEEPTETGEEIEESISDDFGEETLELPVEEIEAPKIDDSFEFDFGGFGDGLMFDEAVEEPESEAQSAPAAPAPAFIDEEALRREIEAKIRLEYETEARLKAEREAEQLRLEHERLREENERLAQIAKEAEERRIAEEEAKKAEEEARRLAEEERQRELEAKKAEEERIRAEIEEKLRLEAKERERVAEAARMAVEEQKRLEAERAEKALREREEALAREAERLRREEEERRALEEKRREEQRRREEEERRRLEEEEARKQVVIVSKRAKLLFRYAVDVNVIKRIKEIVEQTLVSNGKEKLNIHIKAYPQDSNSIALEIKIPQNEMDLLVSMMKALGGASLGITKIILE